MKTNLILIAAVVGAVATAGCTSLLANPFGEDEECTAGAASGGGGGTSGSEAGSSSGSGAMEPAGVADVSQPECQRVRFGCDGEPIQSADEGAEVGLVRFNLDNRMDKVAAVTCVTDGDGGIYSLKETWLPAGEMSVVDHEIPIGDYTASATFSGDFDKPSRGFTNHLTFADLTDCDGGGYEFPVEIEYDASDGISTTGGQSGCFDAEGYPSSASWDPEVQAIGPSPGSEGGGPVVWALAGGLGLVGLAAVVWKWDAIRFFVAGLFTRLTRSRVLDQATRAQIDECVRADPGVHAHQVAKRLGLAHGQTRYHLDVLVREKLLARVRHRGRRHYFPYGECAPDAMRAQAALRSDAAARVYEAVRAVPGGSLRDVAEQAGVSESFASRIVRSLEEVDLIERRREGRALRLEPKGDARS